MSVLFNDLGKTYADLHDKDFPSCPKVEANIRNEDLHFNTNLTRNANNTVSGSFAPKYNIRQWGVEVKATFDTERAAKLESTINRPAQDLKFVTKVVPNNNEGEVSFDLRKKWGTVNSLFSVAKTTNFTAATVLAVRNDVDVGAQVKYDIKDSAPEFKDVTVKGAYKGDGLNVTACVKHDKESDTVGLSYVQRVSFLKGGSIGSGVCFTRAHEGGAGEVNMRCVASYNLDSCSVLKARLNNTGTLGLSFAHRLNENARLVLGSEVDTSNMHADNKHKFGVTLSLNN